NYHAAIDQLFALPDAAHQPVDLTFLTNESVQTLLILLNQSERFEFLLDPGNSPLQAYLFRHLGTRAVAQALAEALTIKVEVLLPLLSRYLHSVEEPDQFVIADFLNPAFAQSPPNLNIIFHKPFLRAFKAYRLLYNVA